MQKHSIKLLKINDKLNILKVARGKQYLTYGKSNYNDNRFLTGNHRARRKVTVFFKC